MAGPLGTSAGRTGVTETGPPGRRPRILIGEDHAVLREALRSRLAATRALELVEGFENVAEILRLIEALKPDAVVLDMWLPGLAGLPAIREVKERSAGTKVVVLTVQDNEACVRAAFQAGADGYIVKGSGAPELVRGIESVLAGRRYIGEAVSHHIVNRYLRCEDRPQTQPELERLTAREREVLRMIAEGRRNREIAGALLLSVKTVEKHRSNLMHKLDLHNTAALTSFALQRGLLGK